VADVQVTIDGIVLYCDESVIALQFGNGYTIQKTYFDDLPFRNKITDGNGRVVISYLGSQRQDERGAYFMCLHKDGSYLVQLPGMMPGVAYTDNDFRCSDQLETYHNNEMEFLHKTFSLLQIFKKGNIGFKEIFTEHRFSALGGLINNIQNQTSNSVTRNITDSTIFTLTQEEAIRCNQFLQDYSGQEYSLLKSCIDEFVWGMEQVDLPTGFEQYTTALEMIFLQKNQQGKKEVLSKRVAVLLENNPAKIRALYDKVKDYYRYRSDSLHEGDGRNISATELKEMEELVREVMLKYLGFCKAAILNNPSVTWDVVKDNKINDLKAAAQTAKTAGTLPA